MPGYINVFEIQQNRYDSMQPLPAPEPYTLPLTMRIDRGSFIVFSVIFLPGIAAALFFAAVTASPMTDMSAPALFLLFAAVLLFIYLHAITYRIRLAEDRISCSWFFLRYEIDYTRITAVRFYYQVWGGQVGECIKIPMLELSGDSGPMITISLGTLDKPENRGIIHEVLKKKASRADIAKSPEEFFLDPAVTAWRKNLLLQPYLLPLTLRVKLSIFITASVIILPLIAYFVSLAAFGRLPEDLVGCVFFFLVTAGLLHVYLSLVLPAIRLTGDRICYRKRFFWKEMEYSRITAVRFYYQDTWIAWTSGPVLELSGDNGETITMSFCTLISPENLPVIYDVLKKKAPRAGLRNSPGVFLPTRAHQPGTDPPPRKPPPGPSGLAHADIARPEAIVTLLPVTSRIPVGKR